MSTFTTQRIEAGIFRPLRKKSGPGPAPMSAIALLATELRIFKTRR